jgi:hypothetical protein
MNEFLNGTGRACSRRSTTRRRRRRTRSGANFYQLYPGRVVDVLDDSTGATVTLGNEISSVTDSARGGHDRVRDLVHGSTTQGVYIEGSQPQTTGYAPQGINQATATSGTFEGLTIGTDWQAVDGRNGDTSASDLSISIADGCIRRRGRNGKPNDSFWLGDPAVIDKFGQTLLTQSRWDGSMSKLETGWEGISYRGQLFIPEYDAKANRSDQRPEGRRPVLRDPAGSGLGRRGRLAVQAVLAVAPGRGVARRRGPARLPPAEPARVRRQPEPGGVVVAGAAFGSPPTRSALEKRLSPAS